MKLILGNPGSGKTKVLLALSEKNNIPILSESDARVQRLLVKASNYGFHIPTPVGNYSPDWAIAFQEGKVKHIYFVAETKGTMESLNLRQRKCKNFLPE